MYNRAADILVDLKIRVPSVRVPVGLLSGGQRQGVAIARPVLQGGTIFIMDEPTAALGVRETAQVLEIIAELRARGKAVIVISHDLEVVFEVADRVQVMRLGRRAGVRRTIDTDRSEIVSLITGTISADVAE
jgi:ABC-type sugar transport system ATPase subunit